jgi:hypothetical protein
MEQMGRNVTMQKWGFLANSRYLLHDRDSKFCLSFRQLIEAGRVSVAGLDAMQLWREPGLVHLSCDRLWPTRGGAVWQ